MNFKDPTGNILTDFTEGAKKGIWMALFNLTPNFVMAFTLIQILNLTGCMDILSNVFSPLMGIFGLPGEAGVCLVTGWLSCPGGIATMCSLTESGVITGKAVAQLIPMIYLFGGQLQYTGRILSIIKMPGKYYFPTYIIGFLCMIIVGVIMRFVVAMF